MVDCQVSSEVDSGKFVSVELCSDLDGVDIGIPTEIIRRLSEQVGQRVEKINLGSDDRLATLATRADIVSQFRRLRAHYTRFELWRLAEAVIQKARVVGDGTLRNSRSIVSSEGDFRELRGYQFGDSLRAIDWKATARTGRRGLAGVRVKSFEEKSRLAERSIVVSVNSLIGALSFENLFAVLVYSIVRSKKDPVTALFLVDDDGAVLNSFNLENLRMGDLFRFFERICDLVEEHYLSEDNRLSSLDLGGFERRFIVEEGPYDHYKFNKRHKIRYKTGYFKRVKLPQRVKDNAVKIGFSSGNVSCLWSKRGT